MWDIVTNTFQCTINTECITSTISYFIEHDRVNLFLFTVIFIVIFFWIIWWAINLYTFDDSQNTLMFHKNREYRKQLTNFFSGFVALLSIMFACFSFLYDLQNRMVDRASNAFAQTESFLRDQYPNKEAIEKRKDEPYYGSAIELRESLDFLHARKRKFTFLYLPKAELGLVELSGALLWYANFSHAYLSNANFIQADLTHANLIGSKLIKANLSRADLYEAKFNGANMDRANLTGAVITATDFTDAKNLTKEQIEKTCWLRVGTYIVDGKEIVIKDEDVAPPKLPDNLKEFDVHSLPSAKLGDKRGEIAYCP